MCKKVQIANMFALKSANLSKKSHLSLMLCEFDMIQDF